MKRANIKTDIVSVFESALALTRLLWQKLVCKATHDAPSMVGSMSVLVGRLRAKLAEQGMSNSLGWFTELCTKKRIAGSQSLRTEVINIVFCAINFTRSKALNHHQFDSLLEVVGRKRDKGQKRSIYPEKRLIVISSRGLSMSWQT